MFPRSRRCSCFIALSRSELALPRNFFRVVALPSRRPPHVTHRRTPYLHILKQLSEHHVIGEHLGNKGGDKRSRSRGDAVGLVHELWKKEVDQAENARCAMKTVKRGEMNTSADFPPLKLEPQPQRFVGVVPCFHVYCGIGSKVPERAPLTQLVLCRPRVHFFSSLRLQLIAPSCAAAAVVVLDHRPTISSHCCWIDRGGFSQFIEQRADFTHI